MNIAATGAGGSVRREFAQLIVSGRLLERDQRLTLVGTEKWKSSKNLYGLFFGYLKI